MQKEENKPAVVEASHSERFTNAVMKEFSLASAGQDLVLSPFQKKLIQNYFIKLDSTLKTAEIKRKAKPENKRDIVPLTWENVNLQKLSFEVVALSSVGLDPLQPNHINLIPMKNNHTGKYDIAAIIGYRGLEIKATNYGLRIPDDVVVELVFENDAFKQVKKDANNNVEGYIFEINDSFDRGDLRGGFYYHKYFDNPELNKIRVFSVHDIEKRKPKYASHEFWGGERTMWKDGKPAGKETVEGWYLEMCWKTVYRAAFNDITIDSEKIDVHLVNAMQLDEQSKNTITDQPETEDQVAQEVQDDTASQPLPIEPAKEEQPEIIQEPTSSTDKAGQSTMTGPGF